MKKLLSICVFLFTSQVFAANLAPLPETAQENGWDIRLVGLHYDAAQDQTEFFYRVRIAQGAAAVTRWQLQLEKRFAGIQLRNNENQPLSWEQDLQPGTEQLVRFSVPGERTTRTANYTVHTRELIAEGRTDVPSLEPLASAPMTASYP